MRTINLDLIMQKSGRVVQIIIAHMRLTLFSYLKDESKNKVALAVELGIHIKM